MDVKMRKITEIALVLFLLAATAYGVTRLFGSDEEPIIDAETGDVAYNIVTLLPKDAIRSIDNPQFVEGDAADAQYRDDELVIGVEIDGEARAYSIPLPQRSRDCQ